MARRPMPPPQELLEPLLKHPVVAEIQSKAPVENAPDQRLGDVVAQDRHDLDRVG
jgi:hypothetical protein